MLLYADRFGTQVTVEFKSFVRSVRNIVEGQTFLRKSDVAMTNTLKITQIYGIIKDIHALLDKAVAGNLLKVSVEYAEIDDMDFTLGNMKPNFLPKENDVVPSIPLGTLRDVLKSWDALAEYDKISILVAYGFRGHYILTCAKGDAFLFGKDKRWRAIFMKNESLEQVLRDIIADYIDMTEKGVTGVDAGRIGTACLCLPVRLFPVRRFLKNTGKCTKSQRSAFRISRSYRKPCNGLVFGALQGA